MLARGEEVCRLAAAITAQLAGGEKGRPRYDLDELATSGRYPDDLTGCRRAPSGRRWRRARARHPSTCSSRASGLTVSVELIDHGNPTDTRDNDILAALAAERGLPVLATNNVHYAVPERVHLAAAIAAVRAIEGLDGLERQGVREHLPLEGPR